MVHQELAKYIENARSQNVRDEDIKTQLTRAGWPEHDVDEALTPQPSLGTALPPPPVPQFGMWVTFQYVLLFIALYVTATSLGGILHHWVDTFLKDTSSAYDSYGSYGSYDNGLLRGWIAAIIVSFPIFAVLFLVVKKQLIEKPAIKNLRARKILFYITLVVTFVVMIGHLIVTIYGFLDGKATTNSFAHLGVTFLIAGSIFFYLLNEVREDRKTA